MRRRAAPGRCSTLLFARSDANGADLQVAYRQADGTFAPPQPMPGGSMKRVWYTGTAGLIEGLAP